MTLIAKAANEETFLNECDNCATCVISAKNNVISSCCQKGRGGAGSGLQMTTRPLNPFCAKRFCPPSPPPLGLWHLALPLALLNPCNCMAFLLLKNLFTVSTSPDSLWNPNLEFSVEMKLGYGGAVILCGMAMADFWDAVNAPFMHLGIPRPTHSPIQCLSGGLCFTFLPSSCLWWGGWCVLNRGCQSPGWPLLIVMYLVMSALYLILSPLKPIGPIN